jgi:hypothetical protein
MASIATAIAITPSLLASAAAYAAPNAGDADRTIATTPAKQEGKDYPDLGGPRKDPIIIHDDPDKLMCEIAYDPKFCP